MKLIVGLGNPGDRYSGNRHNIGFMAVDEIARGYSFAPWKKRFQGATAEGQIGLEKCILLKPSTYMNESGRAVGEAMRFYKLPLGDVIVIHDEIDLKPGAIRVKKGGGNAGHNGLKSISAHAGNDYLRVRLGIDHPGDKALVANYVLQDFAKSDKQWLDHLLEGVARGMAKLVEGSEAAFLSEAARGRKTTPAAKLNGSTHPASPSPAAPAKIESAPAAEGFSSIAAAAAKRVEQVAASLSLTAQDPVAAPKAGHTAAAAAERDEIADRLAKAVFEPASAPDGVVSEPEAAPKPVQAAHEPASAVKAAPAVERPEPAVSKAAVKEAEPHPASAFEKAGPAHGEKSKPAPQQKGGFFSRWFRKRVRGLD